jgi:hypothetical protein
MSYRCQNCQELFGSGERPERTVTKTRVAYYADVQREGWEVVEEKLCCTPCSLKVDARVQKVFATPKLGSVHTIPSVAVLASDHYHNGF